MKKIRIMFAALAAILLTASCGEKVNPNASNERSILSIKLQGQLGAAAQPEVIDAQNGRVDVQISTTLCPDMSKVKVEELVVSYKAKASVEVGGTLDLTSGVAEILVTAESGLTRSYKVYSDAFTEDFEGKYAVKNTAFLGGVGEPAWGGIEIIDPIETKNWLFTESIAQGYGPAASNDDYFEITLDKVNSDGSTEGSCILYGGVDGKHWDCMYKTDYDLKSTFRTIPLGTSHWKREYSAKGSTITFTDKDGNVTGSCEIVAETKDLYTNGSGVTKKLVLESGVEALAFTLKGDYSWPSSDQFTDYTKFVVAPRYLFVRIQKVSEIPDASKTEGSMGNITVNPPVVDPDPGTDPGDPDPGKDPDPATDPVSGTYKVANLKALGCIGTSGFVEVKEKSWMWNSSIGNEYDNLLVVQATGQSGTSVTASIDYQAGADGAYWDYVLIAEKNRIDTTKPIDVSANFGWLPHSATTATIDLSDGSATIGEKTCKVLTPGSYPISLEWAYASGTVTVPANSIALLTYCTVMDSSTYTYQSSWSGTDFDRFAVNPLVYAMIFTKQ